MSLIAQSLTWLLQAQAERHNFALAKDGANVVGAKRVVSCGAQNAVLLLQAQAPQKKADEAAVEERHNFALAKDGAKIVGANKEARKPESVLDSDGDTFLKNECKADKWLIFELSQVTKIDMIRLSQVLQLYAHPVSSRRRHQCHADLF